MNFDRLDSLGIATFDRLRLLLDPIAPPAGLDPIVMAVGEPQHAYPDLVGEVMHANRHLYGKYPQLLGTDEYRDAVTEWLNWRYDLPDGMIDPNRHIVPLAGSREGLYLIAPVVVPESKSVGGRNLQPTALVANPFYQVYAGASVFAGAETIYVSATEETGFLPDFAALDEDVLERAAIAWVSTPANPQGTIADMDRLCEMIQLARKYDFLLVVDECYAEVYDKAPPPGALEACARLGGDPDHLMDNVLVFHSLSKRSSVPGLRLGFTAGDPEILKRYLQFRSYSSPQIPLPILATGAALWRENEHAAVSRDLYRHKIDIAESILGDRFGFYRPPGGFFLWLNVGDGEAATLKLWQEAAVRIVPGAYVCRTDHNGFNPGQEYIRVALVHDAEITEEGMRRIADTLD
jgi:N-succinyldiaminopimelate aminotransferase